MPQEAAKKVERMLRARRERGVTLIEMVISTAIAAVIFVLALGILHVVSGTFRETMVLTNVDDRAQRAVERIVLDLRDAEVDQVSLVPGQQASTITFRQATGWDATTKTTVFGPAITYTWQLGMPGDTSEVANGADDDGDGLVDEGVVTRSVGGGTPALFCPDVLKDSVTSRDGTWMNQAALATLTPGELEGLGLSAPTGFLFTRGAIPSDDRIEVTLTVAARRPDGSTYQVQMTETVLLRN